MRLPEADGVMHIEIPGDSPILFHLHSAAQLAYASLQTELKKDFEVYLTN